MFKYNELSDLLNGSLVTPLSKTDDGLIRCIDSEGNELDPEPAPEPEKDDSEYDGTDEPEPEPEVDPETGEVVEKPGFLNAVELEEFKENYSDILKEISKDKRTKIRVWRDII